ncbi:MAG: zinc ribbon domain-containing protein [Candidatus Adiutrix sp.]|jgi:putative FmdB family regulatory protein|nr:zinc ribbon domain-containing protein [Candidatus Adiutrix sp.]
MPIYEYQCQKCGATTEIMQKFSDAPLKKCSACGGRVAKLMSTNSFQLKGSGWYVTDYSGKKEAAAPKSGAAEPAKEAPTKAKEAPAGPARAKKETPAQA